MTQDDIVKLTERYPGMTVYSPPPPERTDVTAETLREAQANPEKHRDLIVRVAGYSDYFCDLTPALQEEIIARTEQTGF